MASVINVVAAMGNRKIANSLGGDIEGFRTAGMWVSLVLLLSIFVLPFLPETKGQPLPE